MIKNSKLVSVFAGLVALLLLAGCNPGNIRKNSNLEDSLLYYSIQMNRSNFIEASRFRSPASRWDVRGLERFQIDHGQRVVQGVGAKRRGCVPGDQDAAGADPGGDVLHDELGR